MKAPLAILTITAATIAAISATFHIVGHNDQGSTNTPEEAVALEDLHNKYQTEMLDTLTAYFNTHNLTVEDISAGLTVQWAATDIENEEFGFLIATGEVTEENEAIFRSAHFEVEGETNTRNDQLIKFKPL